MIIPPQTLSAEEIDKIEDYTRRISQIIGIKGPFNVQFLVKNGTVYIIELNLRASRSMPYTSKCAGVPLIYAGAKVMLGKNIEDLNIERNQKLMHVGIKTPTFSFLRLKGADPILGVEMTSTGEVACLDYDVAGALLKAFVAAGLSIPPSKKFILLTVRKKDRPIALEIAKRIKEIGYPIIATSGTAETLKKNNIEVIELGKISEGVASIPKMISTGDIGLVINVPSPTKRGSIDDSFIIRRAAVEFSIPVLTRIETADALIKAIGERGTAVFHVKSLNDFHENSPWLRNI
jgi:carbamoyl-phosphate synthase large subunit